MQQMRIRYSDSFEVEQVGPVAVVTFEVRTILDTPAVQDVAEDLYALVEQHGLSHLVLDMTGVRFMSSQALGAMVNLQRKASAAGGQMVLAGVDEKIARMFHVTQLDSLLALHTDVEQAIDALQPAIPNTRQTSSACARAGSSSPRSAERVALLTLP